MKSRVTILIIAIILALLGTAGVASYIESVRGQVEEGKKLVPVLVAQKAIPAGTSVQEMISQGLLVEQRVPKRYLAEASLSSIRGVEDEVAIVSLSKGEHLTKSILKKPSQAPLSFQIPRGLVAISIPVDETVAVSGLISPGDRVSVIATFASGAGDADMTKIILENVEVLATSFQEARKNGLSQGGALGKKTITLALSPDEAEKLVFAEEKGHVWLVLLRTGERQSALTGGQSLSSIFR